MGVGVVCAAILILLPVGIRIALTDWLEGDNERTVSIDNVDFNPFSGRARIEGVVVQTPDNRDVRLVELFVDVRVLGLLRKRLDIQSLQIGPGQADLEVQDGRLINAGGFVVTGGLAADEGDDAETEAGERGWQIGLADIQVSDIGFVVHVDETEHLVRVASATMSNLAMWQPDDPASVSILASMPGGTLKIDGRAAPFAKSPVASLSLELSAIELAPIASLLPRNSIRQLSGIVGGTVEIDASVGGEHVDAMLAGELALEKFSINQADQSLRAEKLIWKGQVDADFRELAADTPVLEVSTKGEARADRLAVQTGDAKNQVNLRLGQVEIKETEAQLAFAADESVGFDFAGTVELADIDGQQIDNRIKSQKISWRGRTDGTFGPDGRSRLDLAGRLETAQLEMRSGLDDDPPQNLSLGSVTAEAIQADIECDGASCTINNETAVRLTGLDVQNGKLKVTNSLIQWKGRTRATFQTADGLSVGFDGEIASEQLVVSQGADDATAASFSSGNLKFDNVKTELTLSDSGLKASVDSIIEAADLAGQRGDARFSNQRMSWVGNLTTELSFPGAVIVQGDGRLASGLLELVPALSDLRFTQDEASWEGNFTLRADADAPPLIEAMHADAAMRGINIVSEELGLKILEFQNLQIKGLAMTGAVLQSEALVVDQLRALSPLSAQANPQEATTTKVLELEQLTVEGIEAELPRRLSAQHVNVSGTTIEFVRQEDGEIELLGSLLRWAGQIAGEKTEPTSEPTTFAVARWTANDSRMILTDRNVRPPARFVIFPVDAELKDIDSAAPEKEVEIILKAQVGKYGGVEAKGTVKPFTERLNMDIDAKVVGFELTAISSYARKHLGYDIARGRLDADIDAVIVDGRLQTESKLVLSKLLVEPADPQQLDPLRKRLEVPLETGLAMLRDQNDIIRLDVPVGGDIASPQFDFADAINQAIGGAMKKTITTTLKLAFPLGGAIFTIVEVGGKARLKIKPVTYQAGIGDLPPESRVYLEEIEQLLKSRPDVRLSICGVATERDRLALQEQAIKKLESESQQSVENKEREKSGASGQIQRPSGADNAKLPEIPDERLLELAQSRSESVKDHMIALFGISEDRLFLCAPKIGKDDNAQPRVELLI